MDIIRRILNVRKASNAETRPRSWCKTCKMVTLTEKTSPCRVCYPHGGQTAVCHTCNRCKACGNDPDARKGYELFPSNYDLVDDEGNGQFV